jgi:outer membrane protein OmpA-like peptidoglycan-associated protein
VRVADIDRSCTSGSSSSAGSGTDSGSSGSGSATTAPTATDDATATTDDASDSDAVTDTTDATDATDATDTTDAAPSTTDAAPSTTDASEETAATVGDVTVELVDGRLVLTGPVADEAARTALLEAAAAVVDPANIDDRLEIVGDGTGSGSGSGTGAAGVAATDLDGLAALVRVMPPNLVAGTVTRLGDGTLSIEGTYADADGRDAIADAAEAAGVASADVALEERAEATASDAARLTAELNDFVAANPIRFQPNSATLTPEASAVVDQVAAIANRYAGVAIRVEGHTDTDGNENRNFGLSADRADTVRVALVARGVTAPMEIAGLGETQPILVNGVEDKAASRRVVFEVSAT